MLFSRFVRFLLLCAGLVLWAQAAHTQTAPSVVINELMWMGSSRNSADEWIELRNTGTVDVDLSGWVLLKKSGGQPVPMLTIPAGKVIPAGGYFLISNYPETDTVHSVLGVTPDVVATDVSLVNSDLQITLADAGGVVQDTADDGVGTPAAGKFISGTTWHSMERNFVPGDGTVKTNWHTASAAVNVQPGAELGTPKSANSNRLPEIHGVADREALVGEAIPFDVTESVDPDGDPLQFTFEFGDGTTVDGSTPVHAYQRTGNFTLKVTAFDGQEKSVATATIRISTTSSFSNQAPTPGPGAASGVPSASIQNTLRLSALLIDPTGVDKGQEVVVLQNIGTGAVSTAGWALTDTKKTVKLPTVTIEADEQYAFTGSALKFSLTNGGASVQLVDSTGAVVDGVKYPTAKTGQWFVRTAKRWVWSPTAELTAADVDSETDEPAGDTKKNPALMTIDEAREAPANAAMVIEGIASAIRLHEAGTILVADGTGSILVTGVTAPIKIGDRVRVSAKKSTSQEPRLRAQQVTRIGSGKIPPARLSTSEELSNEMIGMLVQLTGTITKVTATSFQLEDESGTISIWTPELQFKKGDGVRVTAVVRLRSGSIRLDALAIEARPVEQATTSETLTTPVTSHPPASMETIVSGSDTQISPLAYWLLLAAGVSAVGWRILMADWLNKKTGPSLVGRATGA